MNQHGPAVRTGHPTPSPFRGILTTLGSCSSQHEVLHARSRGVGQDRPVGGGDRGDTPGKARRAAASFERLSVAKGDVSSPRGPAGRTRGAAGAAKSPPSGGRRAEPVESDTHPTPPHHPAPFLIPLSANVGGQTQLKRIMLWGCGGIAPAAPSCSSPGRPSGADQLIRSRGNEAAHATDLPPARHTSLTARRLLILPARFPLPHTSPPSAPTPLPRRTAPTAKPGLCACASLI